CLMGAALTGPVRAQQHLSVQTETPEVAPYEGTRVWSALARKYLPTRQPHTTFVNSSRLESLMRAGNIYLSLQDAIALALENNLDIEYHRYDRRKLHPQPGAPGLCKLAIVAQHADSDQQRCHRHELPGVERPHPRLRHPEILHHRHAGDLQHVPAESGAERSGQPVQSELKRQR